jgi:hypothetical protein
MSMSERVDPLGGERCADCPAGAAFDTPFAEPVPVPVLGPYIGVVGAVLCSLVGAFLLLAPYAFDYRDGAAAVPHSSVVDLATGGGVLVLGLLTATLFGGTLARRLRPQRLVPAVEPLTLLSGEASAEAESEAAPGGASAATEPPAPTPNVEEPRRVAPASEPEPHPAAPAASLADPGGALRDLLTPLVAALAADLRARESGETEGKHP